MISAVTTNTTSPVEEPGNAQARGGTNPRYRIHVTDEEVLDRFGPQRTLPCREDRQKLIEKVKVVLAEARAIAEQSDRAFRRLSAGQAAERTNGAASPSLQPKPPPLFPEVQCVACVNTAG
jgi:hypothetical protein